VPLGTTPSSSDRPVIGCLSCVAMSAEAPGLLLVPATSSVDSFCRCQTDSAPSCHVLFRRRAYPGSRAGSYLTSPVTTHSEEEAGGEGGRRWRRREEEDPIHLALQRRCILVSVSWCHIRHGPWGVKRRGRAGAPRLSVRTRTSPASVKTRRAEYKMEDRY